PSPWPRSARASALRLAPRLRARRRTTPPKQKPRPKKCASLSAKHRTSVNIDYFTGDEGCQIGCGKENWPGDFLGRSRALEWNRHERAFLHFLVAKHGRGHVRIDPSRRNAVDQNVVPRQLRRKSLHQTDDSPLAGSIVRVKRLAPLARRRADGHDSSAALRDHMWDGKVDHRVDALQIHANHFIPFALAELLDRLRLFVPDARVGH